MWLDTRKVTNKDQFALVESFATCVVCMGVLVEPVECSNCGSCVCSRCYEKWKKEKNTKDCIYKCKNITMKESKVMKKILGGIKFKCENECGQEISYSDLKDHYLRTCPKLDYKQRLMNLLKKEDVYADKIKEMNVILKNIEDNIQMKDKKEEFNERIKQHPNYNKHKLERQVLPFGLRSGII